MEKTFPVAAASQLCSHALLGALLPWQMQREGYDVGGQHYYCQCPSNQGAD